MEEKRTILELHDDIAKARERIKFLDLEKKEIESEIRKIQNLIWLQGFDQKEGNKEFSDPSPPRISRR